MNSEINANKRLLTTALLLALKSSQMLFTDWCVDSNGLDYVNCLLPDGSEYEVRVAKRVSLEAV